MPTLYLIDAHAYLHRAYHALPPLTTSKGQPVGAIYGFMRMVMKIEKQYKPDYMAVCFDTAAPTFRHVAYAEYKATRKETDTALISQFPLAREAVQALNLAGFEKDGFEADDLIAHFTRQGRAKGWEVVIVTGDKDALQLIGVGVRVLNEPKDMLCGPEEVRERYGVSPEQIPELFALIGDTSDNVPGVRGIGPKTAAKLIQDYGTLDALLKATPPIAGKVGTLLQEHAQDALKSRSLVTLDHDVPIDIDWEKCRITSPKVDVLLPFLQKVEFQGLLKDFAPASQSAIDTSARDYKTLTDEKDLKEWVAKASQADKLALDTETTGLDPLQAKLVGISLSYQKGTACYIPVGHQVLGGPRQLELDVVRQHLSSLLRGTQPLLCGHNLKFDAEILSNHGFSLGKLHCDTMVASYVLNPSRNSHGLKDLVLELLGEQMTPIDRLIGKGSKQILMDAVSIEEAAPYACADADMTLRLAEKLEPQILEKGLGPLFYDMEMPLVKILGQMEKTGIRIDRFYLESLGKELRAQAETIEEEIYGIAGETFNINSPKQLAVILFEKLKLPVIRKTKTGFSTDEEVLQKLSVQHTLPKKLMDYRELQKLISTYVEGLLVAMVGPENRVHTSFNQAVASTGRLSSSNPNLQNIPIRSELGGKIRQAFIPKDGWVLLSADYSQIDLRMLAHISEDDALCAAFHKGDDIHSMTAREIFGVTAEEVTPELRRVAKSINFGIVYGMSAFGLSQQLTISVEEAKAHIDRYFERYPGVKLWMGKIIDEARRDGSVRTLRGRIRYLPEILASNGAVRGFAERTAMNTPIQGTSADIIKLAMIKLVEAQAAGQWKGNMLVQVHDELLFEIPPDDLAASQAKIKELMETAIPLRIPVVVDLKVGKNWSEMTKVSSPLVGEDKGGGNARDKPPILHLPPPGGKEVNMAFEDLHRPLSGVGFRGAIRWIIILSGAMLVAQQFAAPWLVPYLGLVPAQVVDHFWVWQPITYLFLHGGLFHWLFNMFILWMFGAELERRWGTFQFLKFFFITGLGAALCVLVLSPHSHAPTIGSSGAVFGLIVAFAMLFPDAVMYMYFLIPMKAWQAAALFAFIEFFAGMDGGGTGIARFAHLGGMLTGYLYLRFSGGVSIQFHDLIRSLKSKSRPNVGARHAVPLQELTDELVTRVDRILDKVLKEGVESLTPEEKRIMDRYAKTKR